MKKQTDRNPELLSVTGLIAVMFRILMALILGLALFYAVTLIQSGYQNTIMIIQKSAENSASGINETISNLDRQTDFLSRISGDPVIWNSASAYEDMLWKNKVTNNLQSFLASNRGVDAAVITKRNETMILETHTLPEKVFVRLADICNGQRAITPKSMNVFRENESDISHFIFTKSIKNGNTNRTIGNIYTLVRLDELLPENNGNEILLLSVKDESGHNIISGRTSDSIPFSEWEAVINENENRRIVTMRGTHYFLEQMPLAQQDWFILCLQPINLFLGGMARAFIIAGILLTAVIVLVIFGERILIRRIRLPLSDMLTDIAQIREKGYAYRLRPGKAKEFREVTDNFNELLDDLNRQTEVIMNQQKKLYEVQLLQKESQLLSLQSQIKPHFLYNTLECVLSVARHYQITEIIRIVNGMILIYRYSTVGTQDGTVESEFECAKMYADIINTRSKNQYQFEFRCEDRLKNCRMPKMVLQPLVENAVNHGISKRAGTGKVVISGTESDAGISITVWDNGKGITPERLMEINDCMNGTVSPEHSIGLYNIATRLKAQYGDAYGIRIESEENCFTRVSVSFPLEEVAE